MIFSFSFTDPTEVKTRSRLLRSQRECQGRFRGRINKERVLSHKIGQTLSRSERSNIQWMESSPSSPWQCTRYKFLFGPKDNGSSITRLRESTSYWTLERMEGLFTLWTTFTGQWYYPTLWNHVYYRFK